MTTDPFERPRPTFETVLSARGSALAGEQLDSLRVRYREVEPRLRARIREEREALGWTQDDLARRLAQVTGGFTKQTVYKIEAGRRQVTALELWALAVALRLPLAKLFDVSVETRSTAELVAEARDLQQVYANDLERAQAGLAEQQRRIEVLSADMADEWDDPDAEGANP